MNSIDNLFSKKRNNILSVYFTAGYPALGDTTIILKELIDSGVDMIEIGMPFSDPLADGPVIQHSSETALKNGMSIKKLFEQLKTVSSSKFQVSCPLILMGYLNPVLQYGVGNFCKDAKKAGVSGVILPDLPMDEYLERYKIIFEQNDLRNIFLITPQTSEKRIRMIDDVSDGFIYMVSSSSTTGIKNGIGEEKESYFGRIRDMNLKNPLLIGFGISDHKSFAKACEYANGAIIGSAFIRHLGEGGEVKEFVRKIKQ